MASVDTDPATFSEAPRSNNLMWLINTVSIVVPIVVALLLGIRTKFDLGSWTSYLPHVIGAINTATTCILVAAWFAIRRQNYRLHGALMSAAIALGAIFLVCYVTYHISNPSTTFGGKGLVRSLYYFLLLSHILLSLVVLPLVLRAFAFAVTRQFQRHRKLAVFALPIWIYVSATGVLVYLMISPYYAK